MKEKIRTIADHYGLSNQLMKMVEELNELALECAKSWEKKDITVNLISEMADVEIMLAQIKYLAKIETRDIDEVKHFKLDRQLRRIKEEEVLNYTVHKKKKIKECTNEELLRNHSQLVGIEYEICGAYGEATRINLLNVTDDILNKEIEILEDVLVNPKQEEKEE